MSTENSNSGLGSPAGLTSSVSDQGNGHASPYSPTAASEDGQLLSKLKVWRPSLSAVNIALVLILGAGIFGPYLLEAHSGIQTASAEEQTASAQVDAALAEIAGPGNNADTQDETSAVIDTFYYEAKQRQVPLESISGNPFVYVPINSTGGTSADQTIIRGQGQGALGEAMSLVRGLELQSVLTGSQGAKAVISDRLWAEGQMICGWTIKTIQADRVILTWKDKQYVLKMPR